MASNNAKMTDIDLYFQAGINPKTKLLKKPPVRKLKDYKTEIKKYLNIIDEQNAVNRYRWYNLPDITGQELERLLYYKGQICVFYNESLDKFFYLPFALDGTIDLYGRFQSIHPVPLGSTNSQDDSKNRDVALGNWLSTVSLDVKYDIVLPEDLKLEMLTNSTAILTDYTPQRSQTVIPRQQLQEPIIDLESDCLPFMRTALLNATGVRAIRVANAAEAPDIFQVSQDLNDAATAGLKYLPVVGQVDFQDLTDGSVGKAEEFLLAMQSLDNIRLSGLGLENGGIFQKKAHELQVEAAMGQGNVSLVANDGLLRRQHWCNIINSIWGIGCWCEIAEPVSNVDKNFDGEVSEEEDGQVPADNAAAPAQEEEV